MSTTKAPHFRIKPCSIEQIASRHEPMLLPEVLLCSRCEEVWPCDARQLLDLLGIPRPSFIDAVGHRVDTPSERTGD